MDGVCPVKEPGDMMERVSQAALIVLGLVAVVFALDVVEVILAPFALALVAGIVMSPISDFWDRRGFQPVIGALTSLVLTLVLCGSLALLFQPVVARLVEQAPKVWSDMQDMIGAMRGLVIGLQQISQDVSQAIVPAAQADVAGNAAAGASDMGLPSMTDAVMLAPAIAGQLLTFAGGLFFFVLTRNDIYEWAARRLSDPSNRAVTATRLRDAERSVARYFLTITLINGVLGLATAVILQVLGLPGAALWGVIAFLANFVIYLGPAVYTAALLFAGVAAFDGLMSLLPAASFLALNFVEGCVESRMDIISSFFGT
jgi:predicted PurR-regulated permease PerM